jgi:hypothetical protein
VLSAENIEEAFSALSEELARTQQRAELIVVGGAALVLLFHARTSTKDVDAYFVSPEAAAIRVAAARVALSLDLPADWLNDAAKGYMVQLTTGRLLYSSNSLTVHAASNSQLLAMKLSAWRDAIDRSDARLLLQQMHGSHDEIWTELQPFVPPHLIDKASYAFDDLWEAIHES